jgi:sugar phosphate isomerase/epimerase
MIYISSTGAKSPRIADSVEFLAVEGFRNIELTGGSNYNSEYFQELNDLKLNYQLNYRCHNYFPPPKNHFVLNLASTNKNVLDESHKMIQESLKLSKHWGADSYGFHAGFLINPQVNELGQTISKISMEKKDLGLKVFRDEFQKISSGDIDVYVENNVFSLKNAESFKGKNPFLMCCFEDYVEFKKLTKFNLLLDIAHLKVTCNTLQLNFFEQLEKLLPESDYLHISDNNSFSDENLGLTSKTNFLPLLVGNLKNKKITLEVYDGIDAIKRSLDIISSLC